MTAALRPVGFCELSLEEMRDTNGGALFLILLAALLVAGCAECPGPEPITGPDATTDST